jgi:hypothetical protein
MVHWMGLSFIALLCPLHSVWNWTSTQVCGGVSVRFTAVFFFFNFFRGRYLAIRQDGARQRVGDFENSGAAVVHRCGGVALAHASGKHVGDSGGDGGGACEEVEEDEEEDGGERDRAAHDRGSDVG